MGIQFNSDLFICAFASTRSSHQGTFFFDIGGCEQPGSE
jgi:hypothetical protein